MDESHGIPNCELWRRYCNPVRMGTDNPNDAQVTHRWCTTCNTWHLVNLDAVVFEDDGDE